MNWFRKLFVTRADRVAKYLDNNAQLVDVRTHREHAKRNLPTAIHIPIDELHVKGKQLDPKRPVIVFCASGTRSSMAAVVLRGMGYVTVNAGSISQMNQYLLK